MAQKPLFTKKKKNFRYILLSIFIIIMMLSFYVVFDSTNIRVKTIEIGMGVLAKDLEGFSLLHIGDMYGKNFGEEQKNLLEKINASTANYIVVTGDMLNSPLESSDAFYAICRSLKGKKQVYFVLGENDGSELVYNEDTKEIEYSAYIKGAVELGALYLDVPTQIKIKNGSVWLMPRGVMDVDEQAQIQSFRKQYATINSSDENVAEKKERLEFMISRLQESFNILAQVTIDDLIVGVVHFPVIHNAHTYHYNIQLADGNEMPIKNNLILTGHYNGGDYNLPFIGPIHVNEAELGLKGYFPTSSKTKGLIKLNDGVLMHITPGLGIMTNGRRIPFRIFNPPEITILKFVSRMED